LSASTLGRIAAAMMKARKSSAIRIFSFQSASATTTTPPATRMVTNALRAVSWITGLLPQLSAC